MVDNILSNPNIKILSNIKSQIYVKLFLKVKIALFQKRREKTMAMLWGHDLWEKIDYKKALLFC